MNQLKQQIITAPSFPYLDNLSDQAWRDMREQLLSSVDQSTGLVQLPTTLHLNVVGRSNKTRDFMFNPGETVFFPDLSNGLNGTKPDRRRTPDYGILFGRSILSIVAVKHQGIDLFSAKVRDIA